MEDLVLIENLKIYSLEDNSCDTCIIHEGVMPFLLSYKTSLCMIVSQITKNKFVQKSPITTSTSLTTKYIYIIDTLVLIPPISYNKQLSSNWLQNMV